MKEGEIMKVKETFAIVGKIESEDTAKAFLKIVAELEEQEEIEEIMYITRAVERLHIVRESSISEGMIPLGKNRRVFVITEEDIKKGMVHLPDGRELVIVGGKA